MATTAKIFLRICLWNSGHLPNANSEFVHTITCKKKVKPIQLPIDYDACTQWIITQKEKVGLFPKK